jgi:uncharacterized membrane protein (DUF4010 family)
MNSAKKTIVTYRSILVLAVVVGVAGIALQFLPDFELITFMLALAVLGGLVGGAESYEERGRQQLDRSYKTAFEWMLLVVLIAYALVELSDWVGIFEGAAQFLNAHWPGLMVSFMCGLLGIAGLRRQSIETTP